MPTAGTSPTKPLLRITVPRRIEASPEEVFDAWAEPDLFRRWLEPHRAILRKAAVDELWYWEANHADRLWAHYCRYLRVERPRLLEFAWMSEATRGLESRVTVEMTPSRGATDLVLTHHGLPDDEMGRRHEGSVSLADLFRGRSQLLVYHFMFGPDYTAGCPHCSAIADGFDGFVVHLANHDVTLSAVSRAPLAKLQPYKRRMGWTFPWASSFGSDFNFDFNVWFTEEQQREGVIEYNYRRGGHAMDVTPVPEAAGEGPVAELAATTGTDVPTYTRERPGMSAFALEDGVVYHAYSAYARGLDGLWGIYQWLDRAPRGRNETGVWMRRHDEYNKG